MAKPLFIPLLMLLAASGCQKFLIRTDNEVRMKGPIDAKMTAETPPVTAAGPVHPVTVGESKASARIAIVDVDGVLLNTPFVGFSSLGENPVALFREKLDAAAADSEVKAVVVRINSHGGGVAACQVMRADLLRFKARTGKPVIACLLDQGCGGAYYLATVADYIVAGPASVTGGIGIVLNLYNLRDLMAQFNIISQSIKAGENVDLGSSARAMSADEKKIMQTMADEFHATMKADITRTRPKIVLGKGTTLDGRIFTAGQALSRGMIDYIGDLEAALAIAARAAVIPKCEEASSYSVVLYRRVNDPAHSIYAISANIPLQGAGLLPNVPGLDRSKLPTFLSMWQPELTMEKLGGK